ncbi:hypothetical protein [Bifidobacterium biavatii]|uniref:Uncharacterized protein n=1 Tax=Bifidobacterium biavatii DSM 23969 TaxID=1437608 RepID=A0A087A4Q7_9BIFI|nr:hypothetical protein [Bifidobacterium biavatii]KFI53757.1 hypothetical protein BBIA_1354 [Bifidobacterium biavatii DSM 23969]
METATKLTTQVKPDTTPDRQIDGGNFDNEFFGGGGEEHSCEWEEGICSRLGTCYIGNPCGDPKCEAVHLHYYCLRHYGLELARIINHLQYCNGFDNAHTPEERHLLILRHISEWGRLDSAE